jgi:hypothetical protein
VQAFDATHVQVQQRGDSPISIEVEAVNGRDPASPQITLALRNVSDKTIYAYALQYFAMGRLTKSGGTTRSSFEDPARLFTAGMVQHYQIDQIDAEEAVERVIVDLDYVEFSDRTGWGADTLNSREQLAGVRAGTDAVEKELQELLTSSGVDGFETVIRGEEGIAALALPLHKVKSTAWQAGFQTGANLVWERTRRSVGPGATVQEIQDRLRQPFYPSGKEQ